MFRKSTKILVSMLALMAAAPASAESLETAASALSRGAHARSSTPAEPSLAAVRAATERFRDVKVALAEAVGRFEMSPSCQWVASRQ